MLPTVASSRFPRLDGIAMGLSGLCVIHCLATAILVGLLSSAATLLAAPIVHEIGLVIAMALGAVALGHGALHHGFMIPIAIGSLGLGIMAGALTLDHGASETAYTMLGVGLLAFGHELNRRSFW